MAKKRAASPLQTTPLRQSKRTRSSTSTPIKTQTTPKKSPFFDHKSTTSEEPSLPGPETSGYEDEDASISALSTTPDSPTSSSRSSTPQPRKRGRGRPSKTTMTNTTPRPSDSNPPKGQELWRPGVKADLEPGQEVFIRLPKPRPTGKTAYQDSTIHPNTFHFLTDLLHNNDRSWLKTHDADYRASKADFDSFVACLSDRISALDDTIPDLPPKDLTFRIYRDVRFSRDQTPYKSYFSAAWSRTGRKGPYAAYYVQLQPGGSFVGGGLWHPEAGPLAALRAGVDGRPERLKGVLMEEGLRRECLGGVGRGEGKVVKAFVEGNREGMLKTKPRDYPADHPNIEILRLRNYTIGRKLKDNEVLGSKGLDRICEIIKVMVPFITYLNSVVMPDEAEGENDEPDGAEEEDDNDEEEVEDEDEDEQ